LPGVANDVFVVDWPALKGPLPSRSHAKPVIGLAAPVELENSETASPACGALGSHVNDAEGAFAEPTVDGAGVTVKVAGSVRPVLPASSDCSPWMV
jgi:hypothetical protein